MTRPTGSRRAGLVPLMLIAAFTTVSCKPDPAEDSRENRPGTTPLSSVTDAAGRLQQESEPSSAGIGEPVMVTGETPFAELGLPEFDEAPVSMIRLPLRVENRTPEAIVITATAGAATVVVDTIDPGEALRADLEAPSTGVVLGWSTIDGTGSGERSIEADADSVQIVSIDGFPGSR